MVGGASPILRAREAFKPSSPRKRLCRLSLEARAERASKDGSARRLQRGPSPFEAFAALRRLRVTVMVREDSSP